MTAPAFLEAFLSLILQATLLILLAGFLAKRCGSHAVLDRYWLGVHIALLGLAVAAFGLPHLRILPGIHASDPTGFQTLLFWEDRIAQLVGGVWLVGVFLSTCSLVASGFSITRLLRRAKVVDSRDIDMSFQVENQHLVLLKSETVHSPFCWQIHRPYILLPACIDELSASERNAILRHEVEHLRAGHPLALFLQRLTEIVYWFHPLVWWSSRQADLHREFRSDAAVVQNPEDVKSYLASMLKLAEANGDRGILLPAGLAFGDRPGRLKQRIARLIEQTSLEASPSPSSAKYLLVAVFCLLLLLRVPVNVTANHRVWWSPWPRWTAGWLNMAGISVRDYELDGHRVRPHHRN